MDKDRDKDNQSQIYNPHNITYTWNDSQETLLKAISERSNCMRWLHTQCQSHFEYMNFYLTIPNVIISTLNGSFTMSLNSLFPDPGSQKYATTIIGLVSILCAILITMNQYLKSQQMMESHRAAGLAYGKLHRAISNELAMIRDQRTNAFEFMKFVRTEQDRLENISPSILPNIIKQFNRQFADREIEKPEIAGDLDAVNINKETGAVAVGTIVKRTMSIVNRISPFSSSPLRARVAPSPIRETDLEEALNNAAIQSKPNILRQRSPTNVITIREVNAPPETPPLPRNN